MQRRNHRRFSTSSINDYEKVLKSFNSDKVETEIDPDNYNFYTFEINKDKKDFPKIQACYKI